MLEIPEAYTRHTIEAFGSDGARWLDSLPALAAACARRWDLRLGAGPMALSFHYVLPAWQGDGTPVVLKLFPPGSDELQPQAEALRRMNGNGVVRLLEADIERGALLLERAEPGTSLETMDDDDLATSILAATVGTIWRPVEEDHPFPTIAGWFEGFARHRAEYGGSGPLSPSLFERGERLYSELLESAPQETLLHGDFHHGNVLAAQRCPWLVIDPKGVVGESVHDTAALLRNNGPLAASHPGRLLERRVDILHDRLGFDRDRILAWGIAQNVLSAVWSAEAGGTGWEETMAVVEVLSRL